MCQNLMFTPGVGHIAELSLYGMDHITICTLTKSIQTYSNFWYLYHSCLLDKWDWEIILLLYKIFIITSNYVKYTPHLKDEFLFLSNPFYCHLQRSWLKLILVEGLVPSHHCCPFSVPLPSFVQTMFILFFCSLVISCPSWGASTIKCPPHKVCFYSVWCILQNQWFC